MAQAPPCPHCGASSYKLRDKRWLICKACGQEFDLQQDLCPVCKHLNQAGARVCANCGATMREDKIDQLIVERSKGRLDWRAERSKVALVQKREEEEAAQRQLAALQAEDRARREATARALAEQREKEKRVLVVVGIVVAILVVALIAVAILLSLSGRPEAESVIRPVVLGAARLLL